MGKKNEVAQKTLKEQLKTQITYCHGHFLSFSIIDANKQCGILSETIGTAGKIIVLIKFSPKCERMLSVIKERFNQPSFQAYMKMESFLLKAIHGCCAKDEQDFLHENCHADFEVDCLEAEKEVWKTIFRDSKPICLRDIHKTIKALPRNKKLMIPTFTKLRELILVNPATSCTVERSFSTVRPLKKCLRPTMTNQRFLSIAILNTYKTFTDKLDMYKIGNDFILKNDERYNQFGRFT